MGIKTFSFRCYDLRRLVVARANGTGFLVRGVWPWDMATMLAPLGHSTRTTSATGGASQTLSASTGAALADFCLLTAALQLALFPLGVSGHVVP
jgi:hypothetical protein